MALLFDGGDYFEIGAHGTQMGAGAAPDPVPADAVVCGWGKVRGRLVAAAAYDFTVKGGSIGFTGETKVTRLRELALRCRMPMVWLVDSAGARIDPRAGGDPDRLSLFAGTGHLFREQVIMSGVVPQVAAMVGPGAAGTAYIPGLADFVPMVKRQELDGARRPAAGQGGHRPGHHRAGARRLEGALRGVRRRRRRGRRRPRLHRRRQRLPVVHAAALGRAAAGRRVRATRSIGARRRCSISCPTTRAARTTCTS